MAVETAPHDSVWVYDPSNSRVTVLSPALHPARTMPLAANISAAVVMDRNQSIVHAQIRTPAAAGYPLHLMAVGEPLTHFGSDNPVYRADDFGLNRRTLTRGESQSVWAAHYQAYIIENWSAEQTLQKRIVRDAEWFRPQVRPPTPQPGQPPLPKITGISHDSAAGRLWVSVIVADPKYRAAFGPRPQGIEGQQLYPVVDRTRLYDTVIEVLDVESGRLLARRSIDDTVLRWTAHDEFITYAEDRVGNPRIDIWRVTLRTRERRSPD